MRTRCVSFYLPQWSRLCILPPVRPEHRQRMNACVQRCQSPAKLNQAYLFTLFPSFRCFLRDKLDLVCRCRCCHCHRAHDDVVVDDDDVVAFGIFSLLFYFIFSLSCHSHYYFPCNYAISRLHKLHCKCMYLYGEYVARALRRPEIKFECCKSL